MSHMIEEWLIYAASLLKLLAEGVSTLLIAIGLIAAVWSLLKPLVSETELNFTRTRLVFARYLVLALEFQLAADIVATAVAPTWEAIGKLAAIAVIRTVLNFFLVREMQQEAAEIEEEHRARQEAADVTNERRGTLEAGPARS